MRHLIRFLDRVHAKLGRLMSLLEACQGVATCEGGGCGPDALCGSCWRHREAVQP